MKGMFYFEFPFEFTSLPWEDLNSTDRNILTNWITNNVNSESDLERLYVQFDKQTILELTQ